MITSGFYFLAIQTFATSAMGFTFRNYGIDTLFPGPWEELNKAPYGRVIRPIKIYGSEGTLANPQGLVEGGQTTFTPGSLITYEFKENIAGRLVIIFFDSRFSLPFIS